MLFILNFIWPILSIWILFHRPLPFPKLYEDAQIPIIIRKLMLNRFSFTSTNYHPTLKSSTVYIHCSTSDSSSVRSHRSSCVCNLSSAEACPNEILKTMNSQGLICKMKCKLSRDSRLAAMKEKIISNTIEPYYMNKKYYCILWMKILPSTFSDRHYGDKKEKPKISYLEATLKNDSDKRNYFQEHLYGSFQYSRIMCHKVSFYLISEAVKKMAYSFNESGKKRLTIYLVKIQPVHTEYPTISVLESENPSFFQISSLTWLLCQQGN